MQAEAVNGPTTDLWPWSVPPFRWSEAAVANLTHRWAGPWAVHALWLLAGRVSVTPACESWDAAGQRQMQWQPASSSVRREAGPQLLGTAPSCCQLLCSRRLPCAPSRLGACSWGVEESLLALPESFPLISVLCAGRMHHACRGQPERFAFSFERMDPLAPLPALAPRCVQAAMDAAVHAS